MKRESQSSSSFPKPSQAEIASRAEVLWKSYGSPAGRDQEIWLEAERQLFEEAKEIIAAPEATEAAAPAKPGRRPPSATGSGSSNLSSARRSR